LAIVKGARHVTAFKAASVRYKTLSGAVTKEGAGVVRRVLIYKIGEPEILRGDVTSAAGTGAYSASIKAGSNDRFRVVCLGANGENSEIFEKVSAG
jgi:hypothetical protein